jgi:tetratricopeptide (TPR) repeat protein
MLHLKIIHLMPLNNSTLRRYLSVVILLSILFVKPANSQSIKSYYDLIHQGESAFNRVNFTEALHLYEQAFEQKEGLPFAYDLFHYGYIACKAGQFSKAEESFTKLIRLGLSPDFFIGFQDSVIINFLQSERGKNFIKQAKKLPLYETINLDLRNEIYQRKVWDQHYRLMPNGHTAFKDSITFVDHQNADFLKKMHSRYKGFPDESIIGIDSMTIIQPIYFILLFHQAFGVFGRKYDFSQEIREAIHKGRLNNTIGGELLEKALDNHPLGNDLLYTMVYDSLNTINIHNPYKRENYADSDVCEGYSPKSDSDMVKIQRNRNDIYLDNMQERIVKKELRDKGKGLPLWYFMDYVVRWTVRKDFEYACSTLVK